MKTVKIVTSIAFMLMLGLIAYAQTSDRVTVSDVGSGIFKVVYKTATPGTVKVSIFNDKRDVVFTETLPKTTSFSRPYNFNDQAPGEFKVVVEDKDGKTEKAIIYTVKKVESAIDVSKIANAANKYLLSVESRETDVIQVRIMDSDKNLMHEESFTVNGKFGVVYNLTTVKTPITFAVSGSDGVWKTFSF